MSGRGAPISGSSAMRVRKVAFPLLACWPKVGVGTSTARSERAQPGRRRRLAVRATAAPRRSAPPSTRANAHRHRSDARPSRRRSSRDSLDHRSSGGRLLGAAYDSDGLRRFLLERGTVPVIPNNPTRKETSSVRRDRLSPTQSHRAHVLPPQGLETHRHPLRQARSQLRRRRHARRRHHLVDLIESGA